MSDIVKMTVTNANGQTLSTDVGKIIVSGNEGNGRFTFYACVNPSTVSTITSDKVDVTLTMPLGGTDSGLFRFPRVGEEVLVGVEYNETTIHVRVGTDKTESDIKVDNRNSVNARYLIAYLPSTAQNFTTAVDTANEYPYDMKADRGTVLRYKSPWDEVTPSDANPLSKRTFSEIGFYHKETAWKHGTAAPKVDTINVQSTGDIHQHADNYQRIEAKRVKIYAGKDAPADEEGILAGNMEVDAKGAVTITSDTAITFKVGRSSVTISDTGIIIKSARHSDGFMTLWDSTVSVNPVSGVSVTGISVNVSGNTQASIKDAYGGCFSTNGGVVGVSGADISVGNVAPLVYGATIALDAIKLGVTEGYHDKPLGSSNAALLGFAYADLGFSYLKDFFKQPLGNMISLIMEAASIAAAISNGVASMEINDRKLTPLQRDEFIQIANNVEEGFYLGAAAGICAAGFIESAKFGPESRPAGLAALMGKLVGISASTRWVFGGALSENAGVMQERSTVEAKVSDPLSGKIAFGTNWTAALLSIATSIAPAAVGIGKVLTANQKYSSHEDEQLLKSL